MWSNLLTFKSSIRMGEKGVLSDFECGLIVGSRWADLSISDTADLGFTGIVQKGENFQSAAENRQTPSRS